MFTRSYYSYSENGRLSYLSTKNFTSVFYNAMQFQPGQIEFLTENREGIKATLV